MVRNFLNHVQLLFLCVFFFRDHYLVIIYHLNVNRNYVKSKQLLISEIVLNHRLHYTRPTRCFFISASVLYQSLSFLKSYRHDSHTFDTSFHKEILHNQQPYISMVRNFLNPVQLLFLYYLVIIYYLNVDRNYFKSKQLLISEIVLNLLEMICILVIDDIQTKLLRSDK